MAKLEMNKIEIMAMLDDSKEIVDLLQRYGTVEVSNPQEEEGLYSLPTSSLMNQYEKFFNDSALAKKILDEYVPEETSLVESLTSSLRPRTELTVKEYLEYSKEVNQTLNDCQDVIALKNKISENEIALTRIKTAEDMIKPWISLDIPMQYNGTSQTAVLVGTLPKQYSKEDLLEEIAGENAEMEAFEIEIVSSQTNQTCIVAIAYKEEKDELERILRQLGFSRSSDPTKHAPEVRSNRLSKEKETLKEEINECGEKIKEYAYLHKKTAFASDYFLMRKDKYDVISKLLMTNNVFFLSGYVPKCDTEKIVTRLENEFSVAIDIIKPAEDDEDVPVKFKNNSFAAPVQAITEMYSLPARGDVDPNPVMAFFYYFFFGMMLSDAGYGLIMVLATAFAILKFKPEEKTKNTLKMFLYCGISTVFWGAMYGTWFGDIIPVVMTNFLGLEPPRMYIWMDPVNDLMKLLMYCFLFGMVHLFVGVGVKSWMLWKDGKRFDALCDCIPTYLTVAGAAPLCASIFVEIPAQAQSIGKIVAIVGVALVILTAGRKSKGIVGKLGGGLYALYSIASGYLGDILSYSRLLALGLATGIIGSTINLLGTIPQSKPLKAVLLVVVFIFGHAVNLGINAIGAYVHTNRLQYVEFFPKFYEGGGRAFEPFKANTKHFRFKEETK